MIIVSVHVHYFSFFSFFSLYLTSYVRLRRLHQVTSVYIGGTGRGARQLKHIFYSRFGYGQEVEQLAGVGWSDWKETVTVFSVEFAHVGHSALHTMCKL